MGLHCVAGSTPLRPRDDSGMTCRKGGKIGHRARNFPGKGADAGGAAPTSMWARLSARPTRKPSQRDLPRNRPSRMATASLMAAQRERLDSSRLSKWSSSASWNGMEMTECTKWAWRIGPRSGLAVWQLD